MSDLDLMSRPKEKNTLEGVAVVANQTLGRFLDRGGRAEGLVSLAVVHALQTHKVVKAATLSVQAHASKSAGIILLQARLEETNGVVSGTDLRNKLLLLISKKIDEQ